MLVNIDAAKNPTEAARAFVRQVDEVRGNPEGIYALVQEGLQAAPEIARSGGPAFGFMSALIGVAQSTPQTERLVPALIEAGLAMQPVVEANNRMAGYSLAARLVGAAYENAYRQDDANQAERAARARQIAPCVPQQTPPAVAAPRGPASEAAQAHKAAEGILTAANLMEGPARIAKPTQVCPS